MVDDLVPAKSSPKLTADEEKIARLMVYGLPADEIILGKLVKADWPLTLEQAAKFVGYRLKRARTHLDSLREFSTLRRELLDGKRKAELARNLETLIQIRDDPGESLAADRTVRIKAVQAIEGSDGKASVTVNVNQQTNVAAITPGYVIRLGKFSPPDAIEQSREPLTIEGNVSP
ncbi:MAG: hypothetical protein WCF81_03075 [Roseiarcus sp.]